MFALGRLRPLASADLARMCYADAAPVSHACFSHLFKRDGANVVVAGGRLPAEYSRIPGQAGQEGTLHSGLSLSKYVRGMQRTLVHRGRVSDKTRVFSDCFTASPLTTFFGHQLIGIHPPPQGTTTPGHDHTHMHTHTVSHA